MSQLIQNTVQDRDRLMESETLAILLQFLKTEIRNRLHQDGNDAAIKSIDNLNPFIFQYKKIKRIQQKLMQHQARRAQSSP